jgi:hypothetical protein
MRAEVSEGKVEAEVKPGAEAHPPTVMFIDTLSFYRSIEVFIPVPEPDELSRRKIHSIVFFVPKSLKPTRTFWYNNSKFYLLYNSREFVATGAVVLGI